MEGGDPNSADDADNDSSDIGDALIAVLTDPTSNISRITALTDALNDDALAGLPWRAQEALLQRADVAGTAVTRVARVGNAKEVYAMLMQALAVGPTRSTSSLSILISALGVVLARISRRAPVFISEALSAVDRAAEAVLSDIEDEDVTKLEKLKDAERGLWSEQEDAKLVRTSLLKFTLQSLVWHANTPDLALISRCCIGSDIADTLLNIHTKASQPHDHTPNNVEIDEGVNEDGEDDGEGDDYNESATLRLRMGAARALYAILCNIINNNINNSSKKVDWRAVLGAASTLMSGSNETMCDGVRLVATAAERSGKDAWEWAEDIVGVLQDLASIMATVPDQSIRAAAHAAFCQVLDALNSQSKFKLLQCFIGVCPFPAVVALLIKYAKDETARAWSAIPLSGSVSAFGGEDTSIKLLAPALVDVDLPDDLDKVIAALNFYRFILLREAADGTDRSRLRNPPALDLALQHWLLPLQHKLEAVSRECAHGSFGVVMSVGTAQEVLVRVMEIVRDPNVRGF
eukprot:jgi/Chlat1/7488/Chrsp60S07000